MRRRTASCPPLAALVLLAGALPACAPGEADSYATARVVTHRSELIGGDRALGDLGDILMENDRVRVIIQGPGFSRGFGVYGGSLIDADLRRPTEGGNSRRGVGYDAFGELFPAFFLQAVNVDQVEIIAKGGAGEPARVRATGTAGDFLELLGTLNRAAIGSHKTFADRESEQNVSYSTTYELAPGAAYVKVTFEVKNISDATMEFPASSARGLLQILGLSADGFTVPVGDVALFGATSKLFLPGAGFDLRHALEDAYAQDIGWPAFPGLITDWVASRGEEISYGLIAEETERNYVWNKREIYQAAGVPLSKSSLLLPFAAGGFIGVFYEDAPAALEPGESFVVHKYFIIGSGDVGSVLDEIHQIRGVPTGKISGRVIEEVGGHLSDETWVLVYQRQEDGSRRIYSQYDIQANGTYHGTLEPGDYSLRVAGTGRPLSDWVDVRITAGKSVHKDLLARGFGRVIVQIYHESGARMPGKATAVSSFGAEHSGVAPRHFLFDLAAGEEFRPSDLVPDDPKDETTRRYIEAVEFARGGIAELRVRPGRYQIYTSRGPEFGVATEPVEVSAGQTVSLSHRLARVVDTTGWISSDMHLHSVNSIDSAIPLDQRVLQLAAEGVEWGVSTDHNFVTDLAPVIEREGLRDWLNSSIGLEVTTLEAGHFNGYPIDYDVGAIGHGSFEWATRRPDELFEAIRSLGALGPDKTIVQVNHPRDTILGYFGQFNRHGLTFDETTASVLGRFIRPDGRSFKDDEGESTFSFDFDAIEILNGKLFWLIHHYRVPEQLPEGELPDRIPPAGSILLDGPGNNADVAFPGAVDDWYTLLNLGHRYLGVGTSDTHSGDDEAGYFRSMIYVGEDDPRRVSQLAFVEGLQSKRVVATNGPMIEFHLNDANTGYIGQEIVSEDGALTMHLTIQAATWVGVDRVNIVRNGLIIETLTLPSDEQPKSNRPFRRTLELELARDADGNPKDSWFLVQALGSQSFFPVVRPLELPPLVLTDAVASLAGPLGLGSDAYGDLQPADVFPVTAYAITNPVWVKTAADREFEPPGIPPRAELMAVTNWSGINNHPVIKSGEAPALNVAPPKAPHEGLTGQLPVGAASRLKEKPFFAFERDPNNPYDVRRLFTAFGHTFH